MVILETYLTFAIATALMFIIFTFMDSHIREKRKKSKGPWKTVFAVGSLFIGIMWPLTVWSMLLKKDSLSMVIGQMMEEHEK